MQLSVLLPASFTEMLRSRAWEVHVRLVLGTSEAWSGGGATRHAYLFSGLLRCAECAAHYTARGSGRYICSFHKNRGPTVCGNG